MKSLEEIDDNIKKDIIIEGIMKSKGLYCLVSNPKVGKSMFALQLSNSLANGEQFLGYATIPSPVLYISTESDANQLKERIKLLNLEFPEQTLFIIDRNNKPEISIFDIETDIMEFAKYKNGKLVIIDMLKDMNMGVNYDINNYQDITKSLTSKLRGLCDKYNIAILFTHHLNKKGTTLGSVGFDGVVDGRLVLNENKNDKSFVNLNVINRDFPELDIQLKKQSNQRFKVIEDVIDNEININLVQIINYISINRDCEFTCTEILNKLKLNITPKQLGRLLKSSTQVLENEGITLTSKRTGTARIYKAHYEEQFDENE